MRATRNFVSFVHVHDSIFTLHISSKKMFTLYIKQDDILFLTPAAASSRCPRRLGGGAGENLPAVAGALPACSSWTLCAHGNPARPPLRGGGQACVPLMDPAACLAKKGSSAVAAFGDCEHGHRCALFRRSVYLNYGKCSVQFI